MSKALTPFDAVDGVDGIFVAHKSNLRCTAIRLASGGLCLYSPVSGLGADARRSLEVLGEVTHVLAPNHYHHKGVAEYAQAFPKATLCCSAAAKPRLEKQTGLSFVPADMSDLDLPIAAKLVEPDGLKTGEIWVDITLPAQRLWIVTDAFCGPKGAMTAVSNRLEVLRTFPNYGIADRTGYHHWVAQYVRASSPTMIVPCHGSIVSGPDLGQTALGLVAAMV